MEGRVDSRTAPVTLPLDRVEAQVLIEAIGIQLRVPTDSGRSLLMSIRDRLVRAMLPTDARSEHEEPIPNC